MPRKAEIGATRDSARYQVRLPAELKSQWEQHCEKKGTSQHSLIRALMRYVIQDDMPQEVRQWIFSQTEGAPDEGPKERLEIRLTPSEHSGVVTRAEAEGCSSQRWVINCVRASLTHEPQYTMDTTKALWESSAQLRAIGRNLNQIAKKLNEGGRAQLTVEEIQRLSTYVYSHTDIVAALQDASLSRWGVVHEN